MAIFLAMAAIGCSTAQSPAPAPEPEPVAQAATPPPSAPVAEVEYDAKQLEFWVELTRRQYGKMFYSSRGYGEPPPARLIDGTEALARLRSQPRDLTLEDAWMELLARPGAKVVVLDFPDKPDVPTSVMVVPRPLSPVTDPPMPAPAFIIQFGMVDLPSETPDVPELAATLPDIPLASVEHARRRLAGGESFVILFSSQRCGAWKGFGERARHLYGAAGDALDLVNVASEDEDDDDALVALMEELAGKAVYPTLVRVVDGRVVDRVLGSGYWRWHNLLARAGYMPSAVTTYDLRAPATDGRAWFRTLSLRGELSGANAERADLRGLRLPGGSLAGANLRYANLSDAVLAGVNLSYADLTGANLEGADTTGALWYQATCPDGTTIDEPQGRCAAGEVRTDD